MFYFYFLITDNFNIDLSALLYKWECTRTRTDYNQRSIIKPEQFELNINYRSHNEILKLASSVIGLIWRFFPNSIDNYHMNMVRLVAHSLLSLMNLKMNILKFFLKVIIPKKKSNLVLSK